MHIYIRSNSMPRISSFYGIVIWMYRKIIILLIFTQLMVISKF